MPLIWRVQVSEFVQQDRRWPATGREHVADLENADPPVPGIDRVVVRVAIDLAPQAPGRAIFDATANENSPHAIFFIGQPELLCFVRATGDDSDLPRHASPTMFAVNTLLEKTSAHAAASRRLVLRRFVDRLERASAQVHDRKHVHDVGRHEHHRNECDGRERPRVRVANENDAGGLVRVHRAHVHECSHDEREQHARANGRDTKHALEDPALGYVIVQQ